MAADVAPHLDGRKVVLLDAERDADFNHEIQKEVSVLLRNVLARGAVVRRLESLGAGGGVLGVLVEEAHHLAACFAPNVCVLRLDDARAKRARLHLVGGEEGARQLVL